MSTTVTLVITYELAGGYPSTVVIDHVQAHLSGDKGYKADQNVLPNAEQVVFKDLPDDVYVCKLTSIDPSGSPVATPFSWSFTVPSAPTKEISLPSIITVVQTHETGSHGP